MLEPDATQLLLKITNLLIGSKPTIKFNLTLDISKAYKKYNWEPKISLQEGIKIPEQTLSVKLFPNSEWEILRWSRVGYLGFFVTSGITVLLLIVATILM